MKLHELIALKNRTMLGESEKGKFSRPLATSE